VAGGIGIHGWPAERVGGPPHDPGNLSALRTRQETPEIGFHGKALPEVRKARQTVQRTEKTLET